MHATLESECRDSSCRLAWTAASDVLSLAGNHHLKQRMLGLFAANRVMGHLQAKALHIRPDHPAEAKYAKIQTKGCHHRMRQCSMLQKLYGKNLCRG
jgi:hypothetical protein